jgi:hypothetical protein
LRNQPPIPLSLRERAGRGPEGERLRFLNQTTRRRHTALPSIPLPLRRGRARVGVRATRLFPPSIPSPAAGGRDGPPQPLRVCQSYGDRFRLPSADLKTAIVLYLSDSRIRGLCNQSLGATPAHHVATLHDRSDLGDDLGSGMDSGHRSATDAGISPSQLHSGCGGDFTRVATPSPQSGTARRACHCRTR